MKTAIVTGASSGIGKAIAKRLIDEGYRVYGFGRNFSNPSSSPEFLPIVCDLTNTTNFIEIIKKIRQQETICLIVNAAGVGYYGPHEELNPKKIHELVTINIEIPMLLSNLLLRDLKKNQGTILNISSVTADKTNTHGCAYGATKAALSSFSASLFEETRKYGVRVITLKPDMTKTNLYRNAPFCEGSTKDTYLFPEEIASAAMFALNQREDVTITELTIRPKRHQLTVKKD